MSLPNNIESGQVDGPPRPSDVARFAIMGRWLGLIARHESILGSETLGVAVALAETIGPGFDRKVSFQFGAIAKRLRTDSETVFRALEVLEEHELVRVDRRGHRGQVLERPYLMIGVGEKK